MHWNEIDWDGVNWAWVVETGARERLLPLWYAVLRQEGRLVAAPAAVAAKLQRAYYATLAANTLALEEAAALCGRLAARSIEVVALKGVALLATVYGDRGARPLGDIDLWVRPADAPATQAVLAARGYRALAHQQVRGPQFYLAERTFWRETAPRMQVDLHTAAWARPALASRGMEEWLRAHTQVVACAQGALRVFDATAQFVHLCIHATQHDEARLGALRLHDLALLMRRDDLDWGEVTAIGRQTGMGPAVERAARAAAGAWGAEMPAGVVWPRAGIGVRARCALLSMRAPAVRWLVEGWAAPSLREAFALWCAVLWPDRVYRSWRNTIR